MFLEKITDKQFEEFLKGCRFTDGSLGELDCCTLSQIRGFLNECVIPELDNKVVAEVSDEDFKKFLEGSVFVDSSLAELDPDTLDKLRKFINECILPELKNKQEK